VVAVNDFLEYQLAVGIVFQVDRIEQLVEIPPMIVQIPGDPHFPLGGQMNDLLDPHGRDLVLLGGALKNLNNLVWIKTHAFIVQKSGGFVNPVIGLILLAKPTTLCQHPGNLVVYWTCPPGNPIFL
jgi:hypothetical protein